MCDYTFVHVFTVCVYYVRIANCSLEWLNVVLLCLPLCAITKYITFMYTRPVHLQCFALDPITQHTF